MLCPDSHNDWGFISYPHVEPFLLEDSCDLPWETAVLRELEKSLHLEERSDGIVIEFWWWGVEYVLGRFCEMEPSGHSPGQPALGEQVGWTWWPPSGPSQSQPFCDAVNPLMNFILSNLCTIYAISQSLSYPFYVLEEKKPSCLTHVFCWDLLQTSLVLRQTSKSDVALHLAHIVALAEGLEARWGTGDWNSFSILLPGVKYLTSLCLVLNWHFSHWHTGW